MLTDYIVRLARLHTDKNSVRWTTATYHRAPHKPLLLLAVMDLFAQGAIGANLIEPAPDLVDLFNTYWSRVMPPDQHSTMALPFFHLRSDGFWTLVPRPGKEAVLAAARLVQTMSQLRNIVLGARLADDLYPLLCTEEPRNVLRTTLIQTYFAPELHAALLEQGAVNVEAFRYSQILLEQARTHPLREDQPEDAEYRPAARDQGFRRAVVSAYAHRCALCGIRMTTPDGHTVVDAAHIIPWTIGHNDDPRNGLALCRLCHWTFDEGLVGISSRYVVVLSPELAASQNVPGHLSTLDGRGMIGPSEEALWPDLEALTWHRRNVFRGR